MAHGQHGPTVFVATRPVRQHRAREPRLCELGGGARSCGCLVCPAHAHRSCLRCPMLTTPGSRRRPSPWGPRGRGPTRMRGCSPSSCRRTSGTDKRRPCGRGERRRPRRGTALSAFAGCFSVSVCGGGGGGGTKPLLVGGLLGLLGSPLQAPWSACWAYYSLARRRYCAPLEQSTAERPWPPLSCGVTRPSTTLHEPAGTPASAARAPGP